jgi:3-isopropylmalate/(R)-2-methylmalate dehydratase small subunit
VTASMPAGAIRRVEGRALPMRGDDIDTDRIMPARFLKSTSFEGLEAHLFEDECAAAGGSHPFANPAFLGASVLLVNRNFGCGSSREHAPQALARRGMRAIVGESFGEIFLGNAIGLGIACVTVSGDAIEGLLALVEQQPAVPVIVDLTDMSVSAGSMAASAAMAPAAREALLTGAWDSMGLLLESYDEVRACAAALPYLTGFSTHE